MQILWWSCKLSFWPPPPLHYILIVELHVLPPELERIVILKRIRIIFVFLKWNEYEYEYYSEFKTLFEYIRIVQIIRIRIRIVYIHKVIWQRQATLKNKQKWIKCLNEENFKSWSKRYFTVMICVIERA